MKAYLKFTGCIFLIFIFSCKKDPNIERSIPELSSNVGSSISISYAEVTVACSYSSATKEYGVLYGTSSNLSYLASQKVKSTNLSGSTKFTITGLKASTKYYYCAYSTDGYNYIYGSINSFTTASIPTISTGSASEISASSVTINLVISDISHLTEVGVVYSSTSTNPIFSEANNGKLGEGEFYKKSLCDYNTKSYSYSFTLTGLESNTKYYYRGYATDGYNYYYGEVKDFTTIGNTSNTSNVDIWEYSSTNDSWIKKGFFSVEQRDHPICFATDQKVYFGLGFQNINNTFTYFKDFYEIDVTNNIITQKADYPGTQTIFQTGFSIGSFGYIGGGVSSSQFWGFNTSNNSWVQKADFSSRSLATSFCINGKGYVATGSSSYYKDIWEYNPTTNRWIQKADLPGVGRWGAVGFSIGNKGYVGGGADNSIFPTDFYEFDPTANTWAKKADLPATFYNSTSFVIGSKAYVIHYSFVYEYDQVNNAWTKKNNLPVFSYDSYGFTINGKGYLLVFSSNTKNYIPLSDKERLMIDLDMISKMKY